MEQAELQALTKLVRPMPRAKYEVDCFFHFVEKTITTFADDYGLELVPDFQRGHVWSQAQQERFIEAIVRGAVSTAGLLIQFNCPAFSDKASGDLVPQMQCVDGLQRLTAIRRYIAGEIKAFGRRVDDLRGTPFDARRYVFRVAVHDFQTRADVLQYYLDLNAGGTPHSAEEIERVRALHADAKSAVAG